MATTQNTYTGNGSTTDYTLTFPYLAVADIRVSLDDIGTTAFSLANPTTLRFDSAPGNGVAIRIFRVTDDSNNKIVFSSGSSIKADDLNDAVNRNLYIAQETTNDLSNLTGGAVADGSLTTAKFADNAVTTLKISPSAVTTSKITDANVTTAKIADANVTTAKIADANVTTAKIADSSVTTAKIADDAITVDKLANTAVTPGSYTTADITVDAQGRITAAASGTISTAEIEDDSVTADKLADTAVTAGSYTYSNLTVDAQGRLTAASNATTPLFQSYAIICDQKSNNVDGGSYATVNGWITRDLNTEISDPDSIVSIASNRFSLTAGSYLIEFSSPARNLSEFQARLYNYTDSSVVQYGRSAYAKDGYNVSYGDGAARVVITDTKEFEIQLKGSRSEGTEALGRATNLGGVEIYTTVKIYKEI